MNYLENLQYEFRPFFYLTIASGCYSHSNGTNLLFFASVLLALSACFILKKRYDYRYGENGTRNNNRPRRNRYPY